jgi:predicted  nucleic acid-binding Zn-ribbon protein
MNTPKPTKLCDECGSLFYAVASEMESLCPECAHNLYAYKNCDHEIVNGRCTKCYWDGSVSKFTTDIKKKCKST